VGPDNCLPLNLAFTMASLGTKAGIVLAFYLLGTDAGRLAVRLAASKLGLGRPVELNKPTKDMHFHGYEFGGPAGAVGMLIGLPVGIFALTWAVKQESTAAAIGGLVDAIKSLVENFSLSTWLPSSAINIVIGWFAFQVVLERLLPKKWVEGCTLPPLFKDKLKYNMNGHAAFWASIIAVAVGQYVHAP